MKEETVYVHITTEKQLNSSKCTSEVADYHMKQKFIANMCSFVLQPFPLLINFQLFFHPHTQQPPLPSLFSTREYFTVKILPQRHKYQWLNKICYHFDVLLKKVCQRKFKFIGRIKEIDRMHFEAIFL